MDSFNGEVRLLWRIESWTAQNVSWLDTPHGQGLLYGNHGNSLELVSREDGQLLDCPLSGAELYSRPSCVSVRPDQRMMVVSGGAFCEFWLCVFTRDQRDWTQGPCHPLEDRPQSMAWLGNKVVLLGENKELRVCNTAGQTVWVKHTQLEYPWSVASCEKSGRLFVCDTSDSVYVYRGKDGTELEKINFYPSTPWTVCVSRGGTLFVGCSPGRNGDVAVVMLLPGDTTPQWLLLPGMEKEDKTIFGLAVSGRHLAVGSNYTLNLYELL